MQSFASVVSSFVFFVNPLTVQLGVHKEHEGRHNGTQREDNMLAVENDQTSGSRIPQSHMPWGPFSRMSEEELTAIYNYLQTVKPVRNTVPLGLVKEK